MRLAFALAFAMSCLGCSCHQNRPPEPPEPPLDVSPSSLVRLYRDTPGIARDTYTGRRVRVRLPAKGYLVVGDGVGYKGVGWFTGYADTPPVVLFLCDPPPDNSAPIEVVGVCAGRVEDGVRRGPGIDWQVRVTGCSLTRHAAQ